MKFYKFSKIVALFMLMTAATPSWAWDGIVSGTISTAEITHGENFGFRVHLTSQGSPFCGTGTMDWGFINASESNYNTYVAALLAAKLSKIPVNLYLVRDGVYCRIGHLGF